MADKQECKYQTRNLRAEWHSYDGGAYFVTFCTKDRMHYLGEIADGKMKLSEVGKFADEQFMNVTAHYPYTEIPLWVVMPDHIHAIVMIDHERSPYERRNISSGAAARHGTTMDTTECTTVDTTNLQQPTKSHRDIANLQGWLSVAIGGIKSAITKYAHEHSLPFAWQTLFYDRIIRDSAEMNRIAEYIENNVANWEINKQNKK